MRVNKLILPITLLMCIYGLTGPMWAQEKKAGNENGEFYGNFQVGYRTVDVDGIYNKYKEDINLEKGPRLFDFNLHYVPEGKLKTFFNRLDLRVTNFGGDPFETFSIALEKYGTYRFNYDRRKSTYFYNDILAAGDYHTFDFDRINDAGLLKIWLGNKGHIYADFNRYTKKGKSTTTYHINRVIFEFEKPVAETSNDVLLGVDFSTQHIAFVLEERFQDYKNADSLFLPGYANGGEAAIYPSALYLFILNQPYDMKGNIHCARFNFNPSRNLMMRGNAQYTQQDTKISYYEDALGIDILDNMFAYIDSGAGQFSRKIQIYDFDLSYIITDKLAFIGAARYNNFKQTGFLTINKNETTAMALKYELSEFESGFQFQPTSDLGFTVGAHFERRDIRENIPDSEGNNSTDRLGLFGNLKWRPAKTIHFTADYQFGAYKNPFTLIFPTESHRLRLTLKYQLKNFYAMGTYLFNTDWNKSKNEEDVKVTMFKSTSNQLSLRLGIHDKKWNGSAGYTLLEVKRHADRTVFLLPSGSGTDGSFLWEILYEGNTHMFDVTFMIEPGKAWGLGGYLNYYQNNGSWELSRLNLRVFLRYSYKDGLVGELAYRLVDFKEKKLGLNNFNANIFEISFGYKW